MRKVLIIVAAVLVGVGLATPAQAITYHSCPDAARICFYEDINYNGVIAIWTNTPRNYCRVLPRGGNTPWPDGGNQGNNASSIVLNWSGGGVAGAQVIFYDDWNCDSPQYSFSVGVAQGSAVQIPNLVDLGWNDRINSVMVL